MWLQLLRYLVLVSPILFQTVQLFTQPISREEFETLKETGIIPEGEIASETATILGTQKINNFMSLSTHRVFLPYKNGVLFIDKSSYLGLVDFELQYEAKNYHCGKQEFIAIIGELGIQYKKSEKKIKRAYNALRRML